MSGADAAADVVATRKLTEGETSTLRALLKSQLNITTGDAQDEEDAGDLLDYAFAMIANGKNVRYITEEVSIGRISFIYLQLICVLMISDYFLPTKLYFCFIYIYTHIQLKSMELEVCTAESAQKVGRCLFKFLRDVGNDGGSAEPKKESKGKGNALTNSGALGSSRERKNNDSGNNNNSHDRIGGKTGSKQQRSVHGAAFDRLRNPSTNPKQRNTPQPVRGRGSRGSSTNQSHEQIQGSNSIKSRDDRGGRGGKGHGRGELGSGRGGGENNMTGKRRQRDEEDFTSSALDSGLQSSRTGHPSRQGRGGRGRGEQNYGDKRARHEQSNYAEKGADNKSNHWSLSVSYRGGFSRGGGRMGRGRGRFSNTLYPNKQANDQVVTDIDRTDIDQVEAAAVSESPLIAGYFSGRGSFRGGRGGRFGDGRGGGRAGRAEVAELISAKSWTRPRTMDEGLSTSR